MGGKEKRYYKINHRYRDIMILPLSAVSRTFEFITSDINDIGVITADNIKCKIKHLHIRNIFDLEKEIEKQYSIPAWDFLKRWYGIHNNLTSIDFFVLYVEKES